MSTDVQRMFAQIAPRYDLANQVLSLGIHHRWRRAVLRLGQIKEGQSVLDCASGTGDLALAIARAVGPSGKVVGTDFCGPMLEEAKAKALRSKLEVRFELADALALPYPDRSFDVATIAFGIRNVDDPVRCLQEMARVVKPGGKVAVLEFGQPSGWFGLAYRLYSRLLPWVGGLLTGHRAPYAYLPKTAAAFPAGDRFLELIDRSSAFVDRAAHPLTFGTAYVYVATAGHR